MKIYYFLTASLDHWCSAMAAGLDCNCGSNINVIAENIDIARGIAYQEAKRWQDEYERNEDFTLKCLGWSRIRTGLFKNEPEKIIKDNKKIKRTHMYHR